MAAGQPVTGERQQIILGLPNLESLLRPFACYEEEDASYQHCLAYDGEHGMPASAVTAAAALLEPITDYLRAKVDSYAGGPGVPEFVCTQSVNLDDERAAQLARLNAWIGEDAARP